MVGLNPATLTMTLNGLDILTKGLGDAMYHTDAGGSGAATAVFIAA